MDPSSWAFKIRVNLQITSNFPQKEAGQGQGQGNWEPSRGEWTFLGQGSMGNRRFAAKCSSVPLSGLLSASGVNFAFQCPPWSLWCECLVVAIINWNSGDKRKQQLREEDTERKFGYGEPKESEGLPDRYISRPWDGRVWNSGEQAGFKYVMGVIHASWAWVRVFSPAAVRSWTDPASCLHCCS